ncbi:aminoglycoside adenylyltransferase domain-containing protein [Nocardioides sp. SYSU DS0651]|uniref:aminoglycoside adenylyltransferase domain-containing protein n=1 Tax=Nocardioides sp. SYSU DS0651 TaxID=3415955 RepID=UPI003F4BE969
MATPEVDEFGDRVAGVLERALGPDLVGVYFVGSVALGGYVPGGSDIDLVAVSESALGAAQGLEVASAVLEVSEACPARGVEFTLYRREEAATPPTGADFEVNVTGGPRMPTAVRMDAGGEPGFWYVLDRAIAHRSAVVVTGPPPSTVFADVPRAALLGAMSDSMRWHRAHERTTLHSVLNACRAWRFAEEDVLGSKLEGAAWARSRWPEPDVIDAAVALRRGEEATLEGAAVGALLSAVTERLLESRPE